MKLVVLIVGIVVLTVGVIGALYGVAAASGAQAEYDFLCPTGQMPPQFCALLLSSISSYHMLTIAMSVIALLGFVISVAALAMKGALFPKAPPFAPTYPPPVPPAGAVTSRTCAQCGRTNLWTDRFCANCGAPLS